MTRPKPTCTCEDPKLRPVYKLPTDGPSCDADRPRLVGWELLNPVYLWKKCPIHNPPKAPSDGE